ncbi:MAG: 50S ribosomal protein L11 methyltransferase [Polyangiaceae bacterium]
MSSTHVWRISCTTTESKADAIVDALFELGATGVDLTPQGDEFELCLYAETKQIALRYQAELRRSAPDVTPALARVSRDEWLAPWRESLAPVEVTSGYWLVPTWLEFAAPAGARVLRIEPDLVFGVGSHPSTQLSAAAVVRTCNERRGRSVLDVGTGTGVLAMIAAQEGAARVLGTDIDPRAVRSARRHAKLNSLAGRARYTERPLQRIQDTFDVVVANIERPILDALAEDLARVTRSHLLLSGFLLDDVDPLRERFEQLGLGRSQVDSFEDWAHLSLQH